MPWDQAGAIRDLLGPTQDVGCSMLTDGAPPVSAGRICWHPLTLPVGCTCQIGRGVQQIRRAPPVADTGRRGTSRRCAGPPSGPSRPSSVGTTGCVCSEKTEIGVAFRLVRFVSDLSVSVETAATDARETRRERQETRKTRTRDTKDKTSKERSFWRLFPEFKIPEFKNLAGQVLNACRGRTF